MEVFDVLFTEFGNIVVGNGKGYLISCDLIHNLLDSKRIGQILDVDTAANLVVEVFEACKVLRVSLNIYVFID